MIKKELTRLTAEQAEAIVSAHDVQEALDSEGDALLANDPELHDAYSALVKIAEGE